MYSKYHHYHKGVLCLGADWETHPYRFIFRYKSKEYEFSQIRDVSQSSDLDHISVVIEYQFLPWVEQRENANKSEVIYALADMVLQFAYRHKRGNTEWLDDGGLSALENAFSVLESCGCKTDRKGCISCDDLYEFMSDKEKQINENS